MSQDPSKFVLESTTQWLDDLQMPLVSQTQGVSLSGRTIYDLFLGCVQNSNRYNIYLDDNVRLSVYDKFQNEFSFDMSFGPFKEDPLFQPRTETRLFIKVNENATQYENQSELSYTALLYSKPNGKFALTIDLGKDSHTATNDDNFHTDISFVTNSYNSKNMAFYHRFIAGGDTLLEGNKTTQCTGNFTTWYSDDPLCSCLNVENVSPTDYENKKQLCMIDLFGDNRPILEELAPTFYNQIPPICPCVNSECPGDSHPVSREIKNSYPNGKNNSATDRCAVDVNITACVSNIEVGGNYTVGGNQNITFDCGGQEVNCGDGDNCNGNGTCLNGFCTCRDGFTGNFCQAEEKQCLNGGTQSTSTGECECVGGFTGDNCQIEPPPDTCDGVVCQNGGVCNGGVCACVGGFTGDNCQIEPPPDPCDGVVCQNGGVCGPDGECDCVGGFTGDSCQIDPTPSEPSDFNILFIIIPIAFVLLVVMIVLLVLLIRRRLKRG